VLSYWRLPIVIEAVSSTKFQPKEQVFMKFLKETVGDVSVIVVHEKTIDARNSQAVKTQIQALLQPDMKLILDLSPVEFLDSSGLGMLLSCLRLLSGINGQMKLIGVSKSVRAILELVRFHRIMDIYNDRDEALRAYGAE
jgi:anti-sigma B factor antagonist